jgi:hypothetical protein
MSIENEYFRRLIEKTRRDDAALLARPPPLVNDGASLNLLRALVAKWAFDAFDETNISVSAPYDPQLKRALEPINARFRNWAGGRALLRKNQRQVRRWLLALVGRDVGGMRLTRDALGWFEFEILGPRQ